MRSSETNPGPKQGEPTDAIRHASERVTLACKALSAASNDLRIAYRRTGSVTACDAADMVSVETERVCEVAEQLAEFAANISGRPLSTAGRPD